MYPVFLFILNVSISASWLLLAVIILRFLFKRAPKWLICAMWALPALRLLIPVPLESSLSLVPSFHTIPLNIGLSYDSLINTGFEAVDNAVNPALFEAAAGGSGQGLAEIHTLVTVLAYIWMAGMVIILAYGIVRYLMIRRRLAASVQVGDNVYMCDQIQSPFLFGIVNPGIYLPSGISETVKENVILHESEHLRRRDYLWKPLGYILLSVYWINPLVWISYFLFGRDMETACDEAVIRNMDTDEKTAYSQSLLDVSNAERTVLACPVAFGQSNVRNRVKAILDYKRPAFWICILAIDALLIAGICLITNPLSKADVKEEFLNWYFTTTEPGRYSIYEEYLARLQELAEEQSKKMQEADENGTLEEYMKELFGEDYEAYQQTGGGVAAVEDEELEALLMQYYEGAVDLVSEEFLQKMINNRSPMRYDEETRSYGLQAFFDNAVFTEYSNGDYGTVYEFEAHMVNEPMSPDVTWDKTQNEHYAESIYNGQITVKNGKVVNLYIGGMDASK